MSRKDSFQVGAGWSFPVNPATVVDRTKGGGYTIDLKTGLEPTTGTMVSIPGHEQPVPISKFTPESVVSYGSDETNKRILQSPDMFLGTWRSASDPAVGDAGYLDISKNYPDTVEGGKAARRAAMEGAQWGLWNIDRELTEHNITHPGVRENIKNEKKVDIEDDEVARYLESEEPVGRHLAFGTRTEADVIRTPSGRKKPIAGPGQMTFIETGEKPNYD